MVVAIHHQKNSRYGEVIELHCPVEFSQQVRQVIQKVTGEHPVPVPLSECMVAYFVNGLDLEEACAVLRMITVFGEDPDEIDRETIETDVLLERCVQARKAAGGTFDLSDIACSCPVCANHRDPREKENP